MTRYRKQLGNFGELSVISYLEKNNYLIMSKGFILWGGQIDIIAKDQSTNELVFVEVKTRTSEDWQSIDETFSYKQKKVIRRTISKYLFGKDIEDSNWRIDHVALLVKSGKVLRLEHYVNV
jgi:putative endonuclease